MSNKRLYTWSEVQQIESEKQKQSLNQRHYNKKDLVSSYQSEYSPKSIKPQDRPKSASCYTHLKSSDELNQHFKFDATSETRVILYFDLDLDLHLDLIKYFNYYF